jgi:hypothetical protein
VILVIHDSEVRDELLYMRASRAVMSLTINGSLETRRWRCSANTDRRSSVDPLDLHHHNCDVVLAASGDCKLDETFDSGLSGPESKRIGDL